MSRKRFLASLQKACGVGVAGSILIGLNSAENWLVRAIATALLLVSGLGILVCSIVNPAFGFIGPRLVGSSFKVRITVEAVGRLVMLGVTIFCAPILFNMCLDFFDLAKRGHPVRTEAIVTSVPGGAMWNWVWKDIGLRIPGGSQSRYNLFFHPRYPEENQRYQVVLFPRSKCVLSLQPFDQ